MCTSSYCYLKIVTHSEPISLFSCLRCAKTRQKHIHKIFQAECSFRRKFKYLEICNCRSMLQHLFDVHCSTSYCGKWHGDGTNKEFYARSMSYIINYETLLNVNRIPDPIILFFLQSSSSSQLSALEWRENKA